MTIGFHVSRKCPGCFLRHSVHVAHVLTLIYEHTLVENNSIKKNLLQQDNASRTQSRYGNVETRKTSWIL